MYVYDRNNLIILYMCALNTYRSLCITCGAWAALTLWDWVSHLNMEKNRVYIPRVLKIFRGIVLFFIDYVWQDSEGVYHTGPTTSPENSYGIKIKNVSTSNHGPGPGPVPTINPQQQPDAIEYLTFSPAIDISVLRQVANVFSILISSSSKLFPDYSIDKTDTGYFSDKKLADTFELIVHNTVGGGLPTVNSDGLISEYPNPIPGIILPDEKNGKFGDAGKFYKSLNEEIDRGHRHFSAFHFIYPSAFAIDGPEWNVYKAAAIKTLQLKMKANGAHTSWSSTWAASLWARLHKPHEVEVEIDKLFRRYTLNNLYSLHPPLAELTKVKGCETCFHEVAINDNDENGKVRRSTAAAERGLVTQDNSKVQLDGSMGYLAAINEILVQSHIPGKLYLLPCLTSTIKKYGKLIGFTARGNILLDMEWSDGEIKSAKLTIPSYHIWHHIEPSILEKQLDNGFYRLKNNFSKFNELAITIYSPNNLIIESSESDCVKFNKKTSYTKFNIFQESDSTASKSIQSIDLVVRSYPCIFSLVQNML